MSIKSKKLIEKSQYCWYNWHIILLNTCKQYEDESLKNNKIFTGKIIKGTELHAVFQNKNIEILAYNIKPSIINE